MKNDHTQRRLAAILAADVAGYTRLMEADEDATMSAWWGARKNIIDPAIAEHGGRIVKHTGDGFLAEFPTATSAVTCAAAMQAALADSNRDVDPKRRFDFRMGVNIGDIIVDDEDIYGDGVNIAARLEGLAAPGGICISAAVYEQVKNRLEINFQDMGEQELKHITHPVHYFQCGPEVKSKGLLAHRLPPALRWLSVPRLAGALVLVFVISMFIPEDQQVPRVAAQKLPVVAVVPFGIIGEGNAQKLFGEGLTEELLVALSAVPGLRVISLQKNGETEGTVAQNIRYRIEGSVRSDGERVGISAKLLDSKTGFYLWGGRYDRKLDDILGVQNEVAEKIVLTLSERLVMSEQQRLAVAPGPVGKVQSIVYKGLAQIGRFAETAVFLPQDFFDWVTGKETSDLPATKNPKASDEAIKIADRPNSNEVTG